MSDQCDSSSYLVENAAPFDCRQHSQRDSDNQGEEECSAAQLESGKNPLGDDLHDRTILLERHAKVALEHPSHKDRVLLIIGFVQP